jgi:hypothetical protein
MTCAASSLAQHVTNTCSMEPANGSTVVRFIIKKPSPTVGTGIS